MDSRIPLVDKSSGIASPTQPTICQIWLEAFLDIVSFDSENYDRLQTMPVIFQIGCPRQGTGPTHALVRPRSRSPDVFDIIPIWGYYGYGSFLTRKPLML